MNRLPADTVERLRRVTPQLLTERLAVLAQWQLEDGSYVPVATGENLSQGNGVRREGKDLQMGLTKSEISSLNRLLKRLLEQVDRGEITLVPAEGA